MNEYDVVIIGAGVSGCAVARELSRLDISVCVLDRNSDSGEGTSKANSGIVHAGYDAKPGTLKAKLNVEGSKMMPALAEDLGIPFKRNGSLVVALSDEDIPMLQELYGYYIGHPDAMGSEYYAMIAEKGEKPERAVCDYISGMTDQYSIAKFKQIYVPRSWEKY